MSKKVPEINDLMQVIEKDIVNPYMYTHVKSIYNDDVFEIMFNQKEGWQMKEIKGEDWTGFRIETAVNKLNDKKLDVSDFHKALYEKVTLKAIFHKINYDELENLLGANELAEATEHMEQFKASLKSAIGKVMDEKEKLDKPTLKVIDTDA